MMRTDVRVTGLRELDNALRTLGRKEGRKVLRSAMRSGAKVIATEAKAQAPIGTREHRFKEKGQLVTVRPGNLKRSIKPRSLPRRQVSRGQLEFIVAHAGRGFYGRFLEWGWRAGKQGKYIAPKSRILNNAYDTKREEALRVIQQETGAGIEQAAARLGAQNARQ